MDLQVEIIGYDYDYFALLFNAVTFSVLVVQLRWLGGWGADGTEISNWISALRLTLTIVMKGDGSRASDYDDDDDDFHDV